jgi:hypothetical protein
LRGEDAGFFFRRMPQLRLARRADRTRHDARDTHAITPELARQCARHAFDACLGRLI